MDKQTDYDLVSDYFLTDGEKCRDCGWHMKLGDVYNCHLLSMEEEGGISVDVKWCPGIKNEDGV